MEPSQRSEIVSLYSDLYFAGIDNKTCSYLKDRKQNIYLFYGEEMPAKRYKELLDEGFRRSGRFVYKPFCLNCFECQVLRVPVSTFQMTKSQKRTWNKLYPVITYSIGNPEFSLEKFALYLRYKKEVHHDDSWPNFYEKLTETQKRVVEKILTGNFQFNGYEKRVVKGYLYRFYSSFFVETCLAEGITRELKIFADGKLIALVLFDLIDDYWSSVYCYYDPDYRKWGIGIFTVLLEIYLASQMNVKYYYIGYYIEGSSKMNYKKQFRPNEIMRLYEKSFHPFIK